MGILSQKLRKMGSGEGRGEAKGGFLWTMYQDMMDIGRHVVGCFCCMLCTPPIFLIIGLIFLLSATSNTRGDKIKEYNNAVDKWASSVRPVFDQATFTNQVAPPGQSQAFSQITSADPLHDSDSKLHTYTPLRYQSASGTTAPATSSFTLQVGAQQQGGTANTLSASVRTEGVTTKSGSELSRSCSSSSTSSSSSSSSSNSNTPCSEVCNDDGGSWDYSTRRCTFRAYLTGICLKVAYSSASQAYSVSSKYGGQGCFPCGYYSSFPSQGTNYVCNAYEVGQLSLSSSPPPANFEGVDIVVRSEDDPYIVAGNLTNGSMNFGLSRAAKIAIAIVFFAIGGSMCFCVYGGIYFFARWLRNRNGGGNSQRKYQNMGMSQGAPQPYGGGQQQYGGAGNTRPYQAQPAAAQPPPPGFYQQNPPTYA